MDRRIEQFVIHVKFGPLTLRTDDIDPSFRRLIADTCQNEFQASHA